MPATLACLRLQEEKEEAVALQSIELWCTIADEEVERIEDDADAGGDGASSGPRCHNFVQQAAPTLVPMLLEQLTKQESEEELEEGAWNLSTAGATCLSMVARCIGDQVVDMVMPFVQTNIGRNDGPECEALARSCPCSLLLARGRGPSRPPLCLSPAARPQRPVQRRRGALVC